MLEFSQYLERYLWPNFDADTATHAHIMSIAIMLNEKFREKVHVWPVFEQIKTEQFPKFFRKVMNACLERTTQSPEHMREQAALILLLNHFFNSMEVELCRNEVKKLVSLSMWSCLQPKRRDREFQNIPEWKKIWKKLRKRDKPETLEVLEYERHFLQNLIVKFFEVLEGIPEEGTILPETVKYCERFLEFVIDIEALLPTRRFFNTVLDDAHLVVRCQLSNLVNREEGKLFLQVSFFCVIYFYLIKL